MKLIIIDLEGPNLKGIEFANSISSLLGMEIILLYPYEIECKHPYEFGKFSKAAFSLEKFILDTPEYWQSKKPFINAMYIWGEYCIDDIHHLKDFDKVYIQDLIVFPTYYKKEEPIWKPSWVFGNIIAMLKWSTSLFKIDKSVYDTLDLRDLPYFHIQSPMLVPLWYANRLNLDVRIIINKVDE